MDAIAINRGLVIVMMNHSNPLHYPQGEDNLNINPNLKSKSKNLNPNNSNDVLAVC